jgi:hypothetical protein
MGDGPLDRFVAELWRTPVPAAPLRRDRRLEVLGLNLLDLALNQQHIARKSEVLNLLDATHLTRRVSLEVDLSALTPGRRFDLASRPGVPRTEEVWVPLARQPRETADLVLVSDVDGKTLPTMSAREVEAAMTFGLRRAFGVFLESPQDAGDDTVFAAVRDTFHRARWLVEATIGAVLVHGMPGGHGLPQGPVKQETDSGAIRARAEEVVRALFVQHGAFPRMLDIASRELLLVVELASGQQRQTVRYDVPGALVTTTDQRRSWLRHEYTVRYRTVIPRAVNTYDVAVEVPEGIQIRRFFLVTGGDRADVRALAEEMRAIADRYAALESTSPKLLQLELHGVGSRLAELGRRRQRDLRAFKGYVAACYARFTTRRPRFPAQDSDLEPESVLTVRRPVVSELGRFAAMYEADLFRHLSEAVPAATLRDWADELESAELDKGLDFDTDPREHRARAGWQRRPLGDRTDAEPIDADLYMSLVDDPISLSTGVSKLVLSVLLLIAGFLVLIRPDALAGLPAIGGLIGRIPVGVADEDAGTTISSADAIVTVLLLVPALLISRTQLPPRSVLGRLLVWPRLVAFAAVVTAVALALCVALLPADALWLPFLTGLGVLALLLVLNTFDFVTKSVMRRNRVPAYRVVPAWLHREDARWPRRRLRECVANFAATERADHDLDEDYD